MAPLHLLSAASALLAPTSLEPRILSCIAGLQRCVGLPSPEYASAWGCVVDKVAGCDGVVRPRPCGMCIPPAALQKVCTGQGLENATSQDGTPITFSLPVDMASLSPAHFRWIFADGSTRAPACALPQGLPANEGNERQTIALVGDAGGWSSPAVAIEVVGDLMLIRPNGSRVTARGLRYEGPALNYSTGLLLLEARLQPFSTEGETLQAAPPIPAGVYPNHCAVHFPSTTHRLRLLFNGGVTLDGFLPLLPDRTDLFEVLGPNDLPLPATSVLGLADLGNGMPSQQCERETYVHDGDNYLDICLALPGGVVPPARLRLPCTADKQLSAPKGLKAAPCREQSVPVVLDL